jgi:hypothetical protein
MKKKTVITTEKSEVWVIRRSSGEPEEQGAGSNEAESPLNSLIRLLDQSAETEPPAEGQN